MIGQVAAHHALLEVRFRLFGLPDVEITCVVDTGFVGYMTLPAATITAMRLPFVRRMPVNLADDSTIIVEVFTATILWNGDERELEVLATGIRPLVGTLLLEGSELTVQFADCGLVNVDPL